MTKFKTLTLIKQTIATFKNLAFFSTNLNLKFIFADIMEVQILFDRHHGNEKFIFSLYDIALAPQKKSVNQRRKKV